MTAHDAGSGGARRTETSDPAGQVGQAGHTDPPEEGVRAALLRAAREELVEQGHAGVSLRAVARRAGVSHAAPKHHFDTRAGLLSAVAAAGFARLGVALAASVEGVEGPEERLAQLGSAYVGFADREPALFDLMFRSSELDAEDAALQHAGAAALAHLAADVPPGRPGAPDGPGAAGAPGPSEASEHQRRVLTAWALVHGLAVIRAQGRAPAPVDDDTVSLLLDDFARAMLGRWSRPAP